MEKSMVIYETIEDFEYIYSFRTLIYYGKTKYSGKNFGLWYYG